MPFEKSATPKERFALKAGHWAAMDVWLDGEALPSPIRIDGVKPLGTGKSELELAFFHLRAPAGAQETLYRLRILSRSSHEIFALCINTGDHRALRLAPLTREWIRRQTALSQLASFAPRAGEDFEALLNRLAKGEAPAELSTPFYLPSEVEGTMMHCALRFDGYAWVKAAGPEREQDILTPANERLIRELILDPNPEVNFAMFFFLQRFLGKWGGEMLPLSDPHHTAYRFLFLHLHSTPTPTQWIHHEYENFWKDTPVERVGVHAAKVRQILLAVALRPD